MILIVPGKSMTFKSVINVSHETAEPSSVIISSEGTIDWSHWGLSDADSWNHKIGVTSKISDFTPTGTPTYYGGSSDDVPLTWINGTPTSTASGTTTMVYISSVNNKFNFTIAASQILRVAKIYFGVWDGVARITLSLSNNSVQPISVDIDSTASVSLRKIVTVAYRASYGVNLNVEWKLISQYAGGNINLRAVTLSYQTLYIYKTTNVETTTTSTATSYFAQTFTITETKCIIGIEFSVGDAGASRNITVQLYTDNSGSPGTIVNSGCSGTITNIRNSVMNQKFLFSEMQVISAGTYWMVSQLPSGAISYSIDSSESKVVGKTSTDGTSWSADTSGKLMSALGDSTIVYCGTITGLRINGVNGTALIDNCSEITLYATGHYQITIIDSSNYRLIGVLKGVGTSEVLGTELVPDSGFDTPASWSVDTGWSVTGSNAVSAGAAGGAWVGTTTNITGTDLGQLFKFVVVCGSYTSGTFAVRISSEITGIERSSANTFVDYIAKPSTTDRQCGIRGVTALYASMSSYSIKKVTAPSSSGATIVSTQDGSTYNFTSKHASFNYNESSYKVIVASLR